MTTYANLDDLMQSMGSDTTKDEARAFRNLLVEGGWLDWDADHLGGELSGDLGDYEWVNLMGEAIEEVQS